MHVAVDSPGHEINDLLGSKFQVKHCGVFSHTILFFLLCLLFFDVVNPELVKKKEKRKRRKAEDELGRK